MDTKSNVQNLWGYTHEISGGTMKSKKIGMQALKIAIGSSLAIYIANLFGQEEPDISQKGSET